MNNFFKSEISTSYDEQNQKLAPISNNVHFLISLILKELPKNARVLCVGVGTGAEIFSLAEMHSNWSFVGVDPSADMLKICQQKIEKAGIADRCELILGYIEDAPREEFDAVLSILVGHFIKREERSSFYQNIHARLKSGGYMINTEISFDFNSPKYPSMLKNWEQVQLIRGGTPESLKKIPEQLKNTLSVLPPNEVETIMIESDFTLPTRFFQSFMMLGWYSVKE